MDTMWMVDTVPDLITSLIDADSQAAIDVAEPKTMVRTLHELAEVACIAQDLRMLAGLLLFADEIGIANDVRWPHMNRPPKLSVKLSICRLATLLGEVGEAQDVNVPGLAAVAAADRPLLARIARHFAAAALALGCRAGCRRCLGAARLLERTPAHGS